MGKLWLWLFVSKNDSADIKRGADRDETPPRTPTGNALSSESDIEASSPSNGHVSSSNDIVVSQEEDERLAKELSLKEAAAHDLSHRPKRRRFHESYNFNMKCPTPGCNSLGEAPHTPPLHFFFLTKSRYASLTSCFFICHFFVFPFCPHPLRSSNRETWETFLHIRVSSVPQPVRWWMQGIHTHSNTFRKISKDSRFGGESETGRLQAVFKQPGQFYMLPVLLHA